MPGKWSTTKLQFPSLGWQLLLPQVRESATSAPLIDRQDRPGKGRDIPLQLRTLGTKDTPSVCGSLPKEYWCPLSGFLVLAIQGARSLEKGQEGNEAIPLLLFP